jgi:CHAT domain-containing protein
MGPLPGVSAEVEQIKQIVGLDRMQCLLGKETTVNAVKSQLQSCPWIHLACHGKQNLYDPPKSCLSLYEGNLELGTILQMPLDNAEFVFLAACQTAMGDATLVNESFHLAGGFIAAGFRGAIATMWTMRDQDGPEVAKSVYADLFGDGKQPQSLHAAKALQGAVRKLRDKGVPYERWVPFIHYGV